MEQKREGGNVVMISLDKLIPHPDNPRKQLGDISELTESIRIQGVLQNLTVVPADNDTQMYKIVIGHRRAAAAKAAGLAEVPCVISDMDERQQLRVMLEENMQRADLTIPEQAFGFQLCFDLGDSIETIAKNSGFAESTIKNRIELAKLGKEALDQALAEKTSGHQWTITELIKLNTVDDIDARKKIIEETYSTWQIDTKINSYKRKKGTEKLKEMIAPILKAAGIKKLPAGKNSYSYGFQRLLELTPTDGKLKDIKYYEEKIKEAVKRAGENPVYYTTGSDCEKFEIACKDRDLAKRLKTANEEEKEKEKRKKEIEGLFYEALKEIDTWAHDFSKTIRTPDINHIESLLDVIYDGRYPSSGNIKLWYEPEYDGWQNDTPEAFLKENAEMKLFIILNHLVIRPAYPLVNYGNNTYDPSTPGAQKFLLAVDLLKCMYNFRFEYAEHETIIDGTNGLYEKKASTEEE